MKIFEEVMERIDKGRESARDFETVFNIGYMNKIVQNKRVQPLKEEFTRVKKYFIKNFDELIKQAIESLQARDCNVFLAKTKKDALDYILNEVQGEEIIVKSKTETGKEIGLT
ncbi:MAG: LUD domain-containing protein, partial [Candidatus Helarchaeota archaeon]